MAYIQLTNKHFLVTVVANIVQEYLWEVDYPLTLGKLRSPSEKDQICGVSCGKQHKLTWKQIMCILCSGSPHEGQSDHCIGLLFSPKLCGTSSTCWDIMTNKDEEVHGYALTHRLLYLEVARQVSRNTFKKDSHIACRAHAVPLPCHAARGLECVFPIRFI
jgi:hypothetical protein